MSTIVIETRIEAAIEVCFDLARDVDAHVKTTTSTGERAVAGKTTGLLELGDIVIFEAVHFGVRQRLTSKIVEFDRPRRFVDEMVKGVFAGTRSRGGHLLDSSASWPTSSLSRATYEPSWSKSSKR